MRLHVKRGLTDRSLKITTSIVLFVALLIQAVPRSYAASIFFGQRSDRVNNSTVGATAEHVLTFRFTNTTDMVGSLKLEFCANDPIPETACTPPAGFDASGVVLASQAGEVGFTIDPSSTANMILLTRTAAFPLPTTDSAYILDDIVNPSVPGTYYLRMTSYTSTDGTGANVEQGGIALSAQSGLNINAEVPPYIRFCAAAAITNFDCSTATTFFIDLGNLTPSSTKSASSQFVVATNATSGYTVTVSGTTLTSGNNIIPALVAPAGVSPGTSQFGINLRANTNPAGGAEVVGPGTAVAGSGYNSPNLFKLVPGDALVSVNHSNDNRKFTVSYVVDVSSSQPAGVYATTLTYICLANF